MISIMQKQFLRLLELSGLNNQLAAKTTLFHLGSQVKSVFIVEQGSVVLRRQTSLADSAGCRAGIGSGGGFCLFLEVPL